MVARFFLGAFEASFAPGKETARTSLPSSARSAHANTPRRHYISPVLFFICETNSASDADYI